MRAIPAAALIVFLLIEAVLYPVAISVKDESLYLSQVYILRAGTIFADVAHISIWDGVYHAGHVVGLYPPGVAALLLPATLVDWRSIFAVTLGLHVLGFILFGKLLSDLGIRRQWSILYLLFPPLVLFSRTVMSEVSSATFVTLAFVLYVRGPRARFGAGVTLGLVLFLRYANLIPVFLLLSTAVAVALVARLRRSSAARPAIAPLLVGFAIPFALFLTFNYFAFGAPLGNGYGGSLFSLNNALANFSFYARDLLLVYPLMLVAPLLYRGILRWEVLAVTFGTLLIMSTYFYVDNVHDFTENLLVGARLLLPTAPLWMVAYAGALDSLVVRSQRVLVPVLAAVAIVGLVGTLGVSVTHQRHLEQARAVRQLIYEHTSATQNFLIDDESAKFITPAWGARNFQFIRVSRASDVVPGPGGVAIVCTTQDGGDSPDLDAARALAAQLNARLVVDATLGWRILIWTTRG